MIVVSRAEYDAIRRSRRRTLSLPVRYGSRLGERKRPVRQGGVYRLRARVPYDEYRDCASSQPTRAHAVLWLIDRCLEGPKPLTITVYDVAYEPRSDRRGEAWTVRFLLGEHAGILDEPVFLGRSKDYTLLKSRSLPGAGEVVAPSPRDRERAHRLARQSRARPLQEGLGRALKEIETCREVMTSMKMRNLAKRTERNLLALERMVDDLLDSEPGCPTGLSGKDERLLQASISATRDDGERRARPGRCAQEDHGSDT
jgi:hypothetical protein